jgi:hypothetical protein
MPSPKAAILLAAEAIQSVADDVSTGRVAADAVAIERMALAMASALRSLASFWHGA